jgi:outer membrane protein assembly factor BamB
MRLLACSVKKPLQKSFYLYHEQIKSGLSLKSLVGTTLLLLMIISLPFLVINLKTVRADTTFYDNFDDGIANGWTQRNGSWNVINGEYCVSVGIVEDGISTVDGLSFTDCTISTKLRFTDSVGFRSGIIFRFIDLTHYYSIELGNEYDTLDMIKYTPGDPNYGETFAQIRDTNFQKDVDYQLKVIVSGNFFRCFINGEEVLNGTDNSYTSGGAGLRARRADVCFDNFRIENATIAPQPKPTSAKISGYILDSNGYAIEGAQIIFNVPSVVPSVDSDSSGYYEISAPTGTYHITVWPPFDSNYIYYDEPVFSVESDITKNITLASGCKVSGYITYSSGSPVAGAVVSLDGFFSGWFSDSWGYYFVSVPAGTYKLSVKPRSGYDHFHSYFEPTFVVNGDTTKNIIVNSTSSTPPLLPIKLLWKNNFNFPPDTRDPSFRLSSPAVVDGILYVGANSKIDSFPHHIDPPPDYALKTWNDFYAFNASNGDLIWSYRDDSGWFVGSSCAVADGVACFGGSVAVFALNASNGKLLWNFTKDGDSPPLVDNGIVYVITVNETSHKTLHALNATTGNEIWDFPHMFGATETPAIVNGVVYIGSGAGNYNLNALNASNGERIWNYTAEDIVLSTPAVAGGVVYFCADKNIYALNVATGVKLWNHTTVATSRQVIRQYEHSSPAVANGIVYFYSNREDNFYALKASNGAKLWNLTGASGDPPIVANGVVYVKYNGALCGLNAYTGEKIWEYGPLFSLPTVSEGVLYFYGGYDLFAIEAPVLESPPLSATMVQALTDEGQTVNLTISGNITSSQISNVYITSDESTSAVYLTVTGASGTTGFSNMTIQKGLICNETIPTIYIDDQIAEKQGYTQDSDNYYVWYTTNFSTHQISIVFTGSQSYIPEFPSWAPMLLTVVALTVILAVYRKKLPKTPDNIHIRTLIILHC